MSLLVLSCSSERRQVLSPGNVAVGHCDPRPMVLPVPGPPVLPRAAPGAQRLGGRWVFRWRERACSRLLCVGTGTCWRAKLELLRCSHCPKAAASPRLPDSASSRARHFPGSSLFALSYSFKWL